MANPTHFERELAKRVVVLNAMEQLVAVQLAAARIEANKKRGSYKPPVSGQDPLISEAHSVGAEMAFCKLVNCYLTYEVGGAPGHDVILPDGRKVDVKHTTYPNGCLIVPVEYRKPGPDIYALMIGDGWGYRFAGWCKAEYVYLDQLIDQKLRKPAYKLAQTNLRQDFPIAEMNYA